MKSKLIVLLFALSAFAAPKTIFVSSDPLPERLYVGQVVSVTYNAVVTEQNFERLQTSFGSDAEGARRVSGEPRWQRVDENRRSLKLSYEITAPNVVFPQVMVTMIDTEGAEDVALAQSVRASAIKLVANPRFCGVLTDKLEVVDQKADRYSETQNIVAMEIRAPLSNIDRFRLEQFGESQGIERVEHKDGWMHIFYYAIAPAAMSELNFYYFSPESGDYKRVAVTLDLTNLQDADIEHTDINPNKRAFPWMNTILLSLFSLIFVAISFFTRKIIYLFGAIAAVALIFYIAMREADITIKKGAQIRLLPTETSTIFYATDRQITAAVLKEKNGYVKILLPDQKIGWVKADETQ
ncbi:MAG: hypothetical protein LBU73_01535 [Helicobacteraceae bacterium]|jgi:hypothetical protein|nr:hypothetical protein [Helicobacteraceae bacterium]